MRSRFQRVWPKARVVGSVALLLILLHSVHWSLVLPRSSATLRLLALAAVVGVGAVLLSVLRWQRVLVALGRPTKMRALLRMYFASLFVSNFLPSTVGGDLMRVSWLRHRSGISDAVASVVVERLTGWIVLPFITLVGLLANPELLHLGSSSRIAIVIALATLGALVVIVG
ncbi:MAG: flippase-like domain-containing protein, partial [Acidimicrobiales bacterium]